MAQTVAALFDNPTQAQRVIEDLLKAGFDPKDIGLVAQDIRSESERVLSGTRKGLTIGALTGTALVITSIVIPGAGPAFVAGPVGVLLASTALGGLVGGLVGALRKSGISEKDAHFYAEGVRRGGILVTVEAESAELAARADEIMKRRAAGFDHAAANSGNTRR
jgi:hypothetical protein